MTMCRPSDKVCLKTTSSELLGPVIDPEVHSGTWLFT
jgi:hypothetical protein